VQCKNEYIRAGYRGRLDFHACVKSLLDYHNETLNIWTHLIGFFIFFGLFIRDVFFVYPSFEKDSYSVMDIVVLVGLLLCYQESVFAYCQP
jgi:predicted membrane channel-forming protein YqfA (hemolysin III family)